MKKYIYFLSFLLVLHTNIKTKKKIDYTIKLYSFYTSSHKILKDKWFGPTIKDDFEVIIDCYKQDCPSGVYMTAGWKKSMGRKVNLILRAIEENWGKIFIYSDIDIQFFRSMKRHILKAMKGNDMVFQRDRPSGTVCAGFIVCRANEKTLRLFKAIRQYMIDNDLSDQKTLNHLLRKTDLFTDIKWAHLPETFFAAATLLHEKPNWYPGKVLKIPRDIILHHANWVGGVQRKIAQLSYVRARVRLHKKMNYKPLDQQAEKRFARRMSRISRT